MSCNCKQPVPHAVDAVLTLLNGNGAAKHGDAWKTRVDRIDMSHAKMHEVRYFDPDWPDYDQSNGALHLTSDIARRLLVLERRLLRDKAKAIPEDCP